jgi:hypothetical protein
MSEFNEKTIVTSILKPTKFYVIDQEKRGYSVLEVDTESEKKVHRKCHRISRVNGDKKETRPGAKPEYWLNILLYNQEGKVLFKIEKIKEIFSLTERLA